MAGGRGQGKKESGSGSPQTRRRAGRPGRLARCSPGPGGRPVAVRGMSLQGSLAAPHLRAMCPSSNETTLSPAAGEEAVGGPQPGPQPAASEGTRSPPLHPATEQNTRRSSRGGKRDVLFERGKGCSGWGRSVLLTRPPAQRHHVRCTDRDPGWGVRFFSGRDGAMTISSESSELTSSARRGGSEGGDSTGRNQRGRRVTPAARAAPLHDCLLRTPGTPPLPWQASPGHTRSGGGQALGPGSAPATGPPSAPPAPPSSPPPSSAPDCWATSQKHTPAQARLCGHEGTRVCGRGPSRPHSSVPGRWGLAAAEGLSQRPLASLRECAHPGRGGRTPPGPGVSACRPAAGTLHLH